MPIIWEPDERNARRLVAGFREHGQVTPDAARLGQYLAAHPQELVVVIGPGVDLAAALAFTAARRIDQPVLGVVLVRDTLQVEVMGAAMRAGLREVVPDRDFPALMDACRRCWEVSNQLKAAETVSAARPGSEGGKNGRVVVVFAGKGGCGKSMVSTNLAVASAQGGRQKVCVLDLDLGFGDIGIMLRVDPQRTIVDAVPMTDHMDETGVQSMLVQHSSGVAAVLAPITPGDAERISGRLVAELLTVLRRMFDLIVVDTPSQFTEPVLAALDAADLHLLITSPEVTALKGLRVTVDMLNLLGYPPGTRAIVLNRADARAGLSQADINRVVGQSITAHIPSSADVPASINRGVPLTMEEPGHAVSKAVYGLVPLALTGHGPNSAEPGTRRGLRRSKAVR